MLKIEEVRRDILPSHLFCFRRVCYVPLEAGDDLIQRFAAGHQLALWQLHKRCIGQVQRLIEVGHIFIDIEETGQELLLAACGFQNAIGCIAVCRIVGIVDLLEDDPGTVVHLHFGLIIVLIDLDFLILGDKV